MVYSVELDTADFEDVAFQADLEVKGITAQVVEETGPAGGWPVVEYTSPTLGALVEMINRWFGDDELVELIVSHP